MNAAILALLKQLRAHPPDPGKDCSEIAEDFAALAPGRILRVEPTGGGHVIVEEYGRREAFDYHEVYVSSEGKVFDPRHSGRPIPEAAYRRMVETLNPGTALRWRNAARNGETSKRC